MNEGLIALLLSLAIYYALMLLFFGLSLIGTDILFVVLMPLVMIVVSAVVAHLIRWVSELR